VSLKYFQFQKAFGGLANDGDDLYVDLEYESQAQLLALFKDLGINPRVFEEVPPQSVSIVPGTRWIAQPGHNEVQGVRVFISCTETHCRLHIVSEVDNGHGLGPADYAAAARLEELLIDRLFLSHPP
jgi:hypothetical protein